MKKRQYSIAMCILLSLGLAACSSGGSDATTAQETAAQKATREAAEKAKRDAIELAVGDKTVKWRQIKELVSSADTDFDDPLKEEVDGKISPVKGVAGYVNGYFYVNDNGTTKDLRKDDVRKSVKWDQEGFSTAAINADLLQKLDVTGADGKVLASFHFVNLDNATYFNYKSTKNPVLYDEEITSDAVGYLAIPTKAETEDTFVGKGKVTYKGHVIGNVSPDSSEYNLADLVLNADFAEKMISGTITNRNNSFLDAVAARDGSWGSNEATLDPEEVEDDGSVYLVTKEEMDARIKAHRTKDLTLPAAEMRVNNGVLSFRGQGVEYTAQNGEKAVTGSWGGIFVGDKAQNVVGAIEGRDSFMSFGASEVSK